MPSRHAAVSTRELFSKVPEVTLYFWIIKVLCTTVGETAADYLNVSLNLGLTGTSVATGALLVVALVLQFSASRYVPGRYWLTVTLVSVFGTLVTDNLTTSAGLPLEASTLIFGALLTLTFVVWYASEKTLSIHSIFSPGRETFYWLAILFTFALGTATGDLMSEGLGLGYLLTGAIVAALIALMAVGWRLGLNSVLAFWFIYILTRPLGASIGDYLSQSPQEGGLGLGPTVTSLIFLAGILGIVGYLSLTRADVIAAGAVRGTDEAAERGGVWQTAAVVALIVVVSGVGYAVRVSALQADAAAASTAASVPGPTGLGGSRVPASPLGDMSSFRTITTDTLDTLGRGDQAGATTRIADLETEWDKAQARLKARNGAAWTAVDGKIDTVLRELRASNPDPITETAALKNLLSALG